MGSRPHSTILFDPDQFGLRCEEREGRFGLGGEPKFWVKRALTLDTGRTHILKLVFHEEFTLRVGALPFKCIA